MKIEQWKKECEELHLQFHPVSEQGAFVIIFKRLFSLKNHATKNQISPHFCL